MTTPIQSVSPPPPRASGLPSPGPVFVALYRLMLSSIATRGRLLAVGALSGLGMVTAVLVHMANPVDPFRSGLNFATGSFATLIPIGVLVFGAATLGDPQEDGTLVYLWLRPIPTYLHVLAAWAATVTVTLPLVGLPVLLSTAILDGDSGLLSGTLVGVLVAIAAYAALFVTAGIRFKRALPWGLVYILIWEGFVASAGKTAAKLAVHSYIRSILSRLADTPLKLAEFSLATGIVVPLIAGAVALAYAARRLARTDIA